ncbi:MAG TPA: methyltransferase [Bacteroidetes bacterium]|nr:methyltransferase [Bacteroidota bacterium]
MGPIKFAKKQLAELIESQLLMQNSAPGILLKEAFQKSADYARENMPESMMFFNHTDIWDFTISKIQERSVEGANLEFGVYTGTSINYFSSRLKNDVFYGFDSFEGLKEDWKGWALQKGYFNLNGQLPKVNGNVKLIKGWFDQSLPKFIEENNDFRRINYLHIDCDTFEATETVFNLLGKFIDKGTLILFDEYFGYRGWEFGEYKAFQQFVNFAGIKYRYIAFTGRQVLLEIL